MVLYIYHSYERAKTERYLFRASLPLKQHKVASLQVEVVSLKIGSRFTTNNGLLSGGSCQTAGKPSCQHCIEGNCLKNRLNELRKKDFGWVRNINRRGKTNIS